MPGSRRPLPLHVLPTFDSQVMTGGQRVAPDVLFVFANDGDVVRHEVAHIVTHVAGDGAFSNIPSWLDEGTAVYAQRSAGVRQCAARRCARGAGRQ